MRILVFLLVLANLLFYAWGAGYLGRPENPDADRLDRQVAPEKIRIVSRGEAPAGKDEAAPVTEAAGDGAREGADAARETPADAVKEGSKDVAKEAPKEAAKEAAKEESKEAAKENVQNVCLRWENLAAADADLLEKTLKAKAANLRVSRQTLPGEGASWWVHIPPLPGKAEAEKKAGELRRLGVTDYFIQLEPGPNRYSISLGLFSSERGGEERLAELKGAGVRSARLVQRPGKDAHYHLEASGPATGKAAVSELVAAALPKNKAVDCK